MSHVTCGHILNLAANKFHVKIQMFSLLKKLEIRAILSPTFHVPRGDSQLVVSLAGLGGGPAVHSRHPAPAYRLPRHLPDPVVTYIRFDVKNFFHPEMIY